MGASDRVSQLPVLICLTPVKNEAWIFRRQLECASLWADHIIVGDQMSTDGTREIAAEFPKVILLDNPDRKYDEGERQRIVFEAARGIPGKRIFLAIDSDEAITANWMTSPEWDKIKSAAPGTVIRFQWVNLLPGMKTAWMTPGRIAMGFVDDNSSNHATGQFHTSRLPVPAGTPELILEDIKVLHFQHVNWDRMKSKQARYLCYERVFSKWKRAINLYRQYHTMDAIPPDQIQPVREEWFEGYEARGIDMRTVNQEAVYPPDKEVLKLLSEHGTGVFRKMDIWSVDWAAKAKALGLVVTDGQYDDPRSGLDKLIHRWLARTQRYKDKMSIRYMQRALRLLGW